MSALIQRPGRCRQCVLRLAAVAAVSLLGPGCGSSDPDQIPAVPAEGTITYKGQPLETGQVQFIPEQGHPAYADVANGRFRLGTYGQGDGAIPGKHKVGIVSVKEVPSKRKTSDPDTIDLIPQKYGSPDGSGIVVEIPPSGKRDIAIELR